MWQFMFNPSSEYSFVQEAPAYSGLNNVTFYVGLKKGYLGWARRLGRVELYLKQYCVLCDHFLDIMTDKRTHKPLVAGSKPAAATEDRNFGSSICTQVTLFSLRNLAVFSSSLQLRCLNSTASRYWPKVLITAVNICCP